MSRAVSIALVGLMAAVTVTGCQIADTRVQDFKRLSGQLEAVADKRQVRQWFGAKSARLGYAQVADSQTGQLDLVVEGHRGALSELAGMEAEWAGYDWRSGDVDIQDGLENYFAAARTFYGRQELIINYFELVSPLIDHEMQAREAFFVSSASKEKVAIGVAYEKALASVIERMSDVDPPESLKGLHAVETDWFKARLKHLARSQEASQAEDTETVANLIAEATAEWAAFGQSAEVLENELAHESSEAKLGQKMDHLLHEALEEVLREI